jgi:hypothetical protein
MRPIVGDGRAGFRGDWTTASNGTSDFVVIDVAELFGELV